MAKPDKSAEVVDSASTIDKATEEQVKKEDKKQKKLEAKQKKEKAKKVQNSSKEPKRNKAKETVAELKKVTWPTFGKVVKNTLLVLGITIAFTLLLFVIDRVLSWLYQLMVSGTVSNWF